MLRIGFLRHTAECVILKNQPIRAGKLIALRYRIRLFLPQLLLSRAVVRLPNVTKIEIKCKFALV